MAGSYEVYSVQFVHGKDITMGTDTIAAIATAMTSSGIGIRKNPAETEAVSITDRIFEMKNQKKVRRYASTYNSLWSLFMMEMK